MRVLVVDDEKLIRDVIKEYLLLENFEVEEASNGLEAVDKVKKDDLVLTVGAGDVVKVGELLLNS